MARLHTPKKILELRGSRHLRYRENEPEVAIPAVIGEPPSWVSPDAKKHWYDIGGTLHRAGIYSVVDTMALGLLIDAFAQYLEAKETLDTEGLYNEGAEGLKAHPALREMRAARETTISLMKQFGMTPSSRAGIIAQKLDEKDDAEAFFQKIKKA